MTGDEILAALHAHQGYVIIRKTGAFKVGDVLAPPDICFDEKVVGIPLRITGLATFAEYEKQRLSLPAFGVALNPPQPELNHYFVEAAD